MELNLTDTFKTKEDLIQHITDYASETHFKFNITETPRTLSFVCKGKQEFNCDASIVTCFKKKDNCFSIKRMNLKHKCPIANNEFANTDEFLRNEIFNNITDYSSIRVGEIVSILYHRGIRVGYSSVYNLLKSKNTEDIKLSFYRKLSSDNKSNDMTNSITEEFCTELSNINFDKLDVCYCSNMLFYKIKNYIDILYPLVEIKYHKRKEGIVIFGVLYDPIDEPVIYSCVVSDNNSDEEAIKYFLYNTNHSDYIIEYDPLLIKILEDLKINYFVKTRDICKYLYSNINNKGDIETYWNICNGINCKNTNDNLEDKENNNNLQIKQKPITSQFMSQMLHLDEIRFIKSKSNIKLLNINNLPECDVDYINYGVFSLSFYECINAIIKLSNDNLKLKKKFVRHDPKSLFGYNVVSRIERNESSILKEECKVDLENGICECGMYQDLLIPCVHACKCIREERLDPFLYVSSVYSKEQYNKLDEILPVMNINIKMSSDKFILKKGPGRPKKNNGKEMEIIVE